MHASPGSHETLVHASPGSHDTLVHASPGSHDTGLVYASPGSQSEKPMGGQFSVELINKTDISNEDSIECCNLQISQYLHFSLLTHGSLQIFSHGK